MKYIYIPRKGGKIFKNEVEPIKKKKRHRIIKGKEIEGSVRVEVSFAGEKSSERREKIYGGNHLLGGIMKTSLKNILL